MLEKINGKTKRSRVHSPFWGNNKKLLGAPCTHYISVLLTTSNPSNQLMLILNNSTIHLASEVDELTAPPL
jgi:hypothetical protein